MKELNRRSFLEVAGLTVLPAVLPAIPLTAFAQKGSGELTESQRVFFINEGPFYKPTEFIDKLSKINQATEIGRDSYGQGGSVEVLTKRLAAITGKEAGIFLTTGTLANQLAISELSGRNSKVFVQETSHVYRDEADASQTVFNKRLIPLAKGKASFSVEELEESIRYHNENEYFETGTGAVSIEVPVRRCDNRLFPIEDIRKISRFCRKNGYKLHLDGARIHIASAYSGVSVREYASYFDTVYICLYKYLGAAGGAVLCGEKSVIDRMNHLSKIHGGSVFTNWPNAAMALHHLEGIDSRLQKMVSQSKELFSLLHQIQELEISGFKDGTNSFNLRVSPTLNVKRFKDSLRNNYITTGTLHDDGVIKMKINETLLYQDNDRIFKAFHDAVSASKT